MINHSPKVLIYATNKQWGGSEHLWFDAISYLIEKGFDVHVVCDRTLLDFKKQADLTSRCFLVYIQKYSIGVKYVLRFIRKLFGLVFEFDSRIRLIKSIRPDFVFVNQGLNFDAFDLLKWLSENNIKYGILSHAVDHRKPFNPIIVDALKCGFAKSSFNGFVSEANIVQTSTMIDMKIPRTRVFRNPVSMPHESNILSFPETDHGFNLAFVGRIDFMVKGQDLILEVLKNPKWLNRELSVRFYGEGPDTQNLEQILLEFPKSKHVYAGFRKPDEIWMENHALLLTSHFEGLPIVIIEAGLFGRTCVVTNVSGNAELITDNINGFIAQSDSIDDIDEALERAWTHRSEWDKMGDLLRQKMLDTMPNQPGQILADAIVEQV